MIITAKFASVCPCCNSRIAVGSKVEWQSGQKARHVACASAPGARIVASAPARITSSARRGKWTGCSCGSVEEYTKNSDCWHCKHDAE